ncbi:hypothetical protein RRG08_034447 [Elysia crispata]|uniref:Uncharacterized protein n=1 Tax=Elysia crispata TaxID=231223 RepID=A0AAE1CL47_9GAST|nr:hypothetical protein RRG08_034447 [Elysia crispata]
MTQPADFANSVQSKAVLHSLSHGLHVTAVDTAALGISCLWTGQQIMGPCLMWPVSGWSVKVVSMKCTSCYL